MSHETGFLDRVVSVEGVEHRYVVYVPVEYDPSRTWPAILFLHGYGESGKDGLLQIAVGLGPAIMRSRHEWPFITVFPQKPEHKALWPNFVPMLDAIQEEVEREFPLDRARLYLTGLSQGGHGAFMLATHLRWRFAAIAPICGFPDPSVVQELRDTPVWAFHGELDSVVLPDRAGEVIGSLRHEGCDAKMSLYPDLEHNSWDRAFREERLGEWFLLHSRSDVDSNR